MTEKPIPEFGSSPTLLDDACADPALMRRLVDEIEQGAPNVEDLPADKVLFQGDIAKKGGEFHIWDGTAWISLKDAMNRQYAVQA